MKNITFETVAEELDYVAKLLHYAGFDFDKTTKQVSYQGMVLEQATDYAEAVFFWQGGYHALVREACTDLQKLEEHSDSRCRSR